MYNETQVQDLSIGNDGLLQGRGILYGKRGHYCSNNGNVHE
jgi:hypothetical protein